MRKKAIILAAGMGTRLKPLTLTTHKCLTEVNGTPILVNALSLLEMNGFEQTTIVVGYLREQIQTRVGNSFGRMRIEYAENLDYAQTNTSQSLQIGLEKTAEYDELYVLEGDVFFEQGVLDKLMKCEQANATVLEAYNPALDGTFVELDTEGFVIDWTHKSRRSESYIIEDKYKTVNIHKFRADFVAGILSKYLQRSINEQIGKASMEEVMEKIVHVNPDLVKGVILSHEKWVEIDEEPDLHLAEQLFV